MDSKPMPVYEDFAVRTEWAHETADITLIAHLPGFSKDQLKVQVTSTGNSRISGERPIGGNKFNRFFKEVPVPSNCDRNKIRANYKDNKLYVKFPKLIAPVDEKSEKAKPLIEDQTRRAADVPEKQKNGVEQAIQKRPPKGKEADEVSEQTPGKQKEIKDDSKSNASNESDPRLMEKDKKGSRQSEKPFDSVPYAAQERVIGGSAKGIKNQRKVMNMVLAVLLVAVIAIYFKNAIMALRNY
ncbi:hypothetical protein F3Y22_tig00116997pilonHSYRG00229 [Hibiscus syriacus]|uniref:SHSP domain-containing protein n=1 Tax=Hibiscus syriacus TaxID=106335 RepID=A0A6A2XE55_HIBSY|nr:inactive protein RESTRICTED TEV MOVEMENT 2-like [Hibiscus syriacus]KAE8656719.1 hypothetical protein F3Y22_tig00116997pilonHSYRG00229 [Hibiscus syriacus]